jgi:hypothetical protein
VEIALRPGPKGQPIWTLRGYPDGTLDTGKAPNGDDPPQAVGVDGVGYAVRIASPRRWTCEWRIPLAAVGLRVDSQSRAGFNITVRKAAADLWQMWESTRGHSYDVERAGLLVLEP